MCATSIERSMLGLKCLYVSDVYRGVRLFCPGVRISIHFSSPQRLKRASRASALSFYRLTKLDRLSVPTIADAFSPFSVPRNFFVKVGEVVKWFVYKAVFISDQSLYFQQSSSFCPTFPNFILYTARQSALLSLHQNYFKDAFDDVLIPWAPKYWDPRSTSR